MNYFNPEYLFVQDNILFIANNSLTAELQKLIDINANISSYDLPTLWDLKENDTKRELQLHIDFDIDIITIAFNEEDINLLLEHKDLEALGILIEFNPEQNETDNILFVTGIGEGLHIIY